MTTTTIPPVVYDVTDEDVAIAANAIADVAGTKDCPNYDEIERAGLMRNHVRGAEAALRRLAVRRAELIDTGHLTIPEAYCDEDGDRWYIPGHVPAEAAVLAVTVSMARQIGNDEAIEFLVGDDIDSPDGDAKRVISNALLTQVSHRWIVWTTEHRDRFEFTDPGTDGAEPLTVLAQ